MQEESANFKCLYTQPVTLTSLHVCGSGGIQRIRQAAVRISGLDWIGVCLLKSCCEADPSGLSHSLAVKICKAGENIRV